MTTEASTADLALPNGTILKGGYVKHTAYGNYGQRTIIFGRDETGNLVLAQNGDVLTMGKNVPAVLRDFLALHWPKEKATIFKKDATPAPEQ